MLEDNKVQEEQGLSTALRSWVDALGREGVITDSGTISYYQNTTFQTYNSVIAILKPKNREQVQECVRIANQYKIPLYPISKGNNWGYGSRVPPQDGCAVISLEKMDNITGYDEDMAYITVEPGVTFQQVCDFLKEKNSALVGPGLGSTKNASLIGNALERGIGKGIYGDRFQYSCNMEIVLPTGEFIQTGFGTISSAFSRNLYRWGVGPSIDGIFTQSNFGIITAMTFWLSRRPEYFQTIFYTIKNNEQLERSVDALRQLRLEGTLTTTSTLANSHRILSMKRQFPKETDEDKALPQEYIEELQDNSLNGASWVGDDAILAPTKRIGKARAKRVKQVLGKAADKIIFIDDTSAVLFKILWKPIKLFTGVDLRELLFFFYNSFYLGKPMEKQLAICYWRKKTPVPTKMDPDKDKCGIMWCSPSVPFHGGHVKKVLDILETIYKKYQFEPNIGMNFMSDRAIAFTAAIIYDRETAGHDEKAMQCYKEMMETLIAAGYPPYRLGVQSMDRMLSTSPEYVDFINKLKQSIDPNNILSPGHYGIGG